MKPLFEGIPNFFYDLICRIIPGGVLIAIFRPNWITCTESVFAIAAVVLGAWALGLTLDVVSAGGWARPTLGKLEEIYSGSSNMTRKLWSSHRRRSVYDLETFRRRSILKAMAEVAMFRGLIAISAFVIVSPICGGELPKGLSEDKQWIAVLAFPAFILCWLQRRRERDCEWHEALTKFRHDRRRARGS